MITHPSNRSFSIAERTVLHNSYAQNLTYWKNRVEDVLINDFLDNGPAPFRSHLEKEELGFSEPDMMAEFNNRVQGMVSDFFSWVMQSDILMASAYRFVSGHFSEFMLLEYTEKNDTLLPEFIGKIYPILVTFNAERQVNHSGIAQRVLSDKWHGNWAVNPAGKREYCLTLTQPSGVRYQMNAPTRTEAYKLILLSLRAVTRTIDTDKMISRKDYRDSVVRFAHCPRGNNMFLVVDLAKRGNRA